MRRSGVRSSSSPPSGHPKLSRNLPINPKALERSTLQGVLVRDVSRRHPGSKFRWQQQAGEFWARNGHSRPHPVVQPRSLSGLMSNRKFPAEADPCAARLPGSSASRAAPAPTQAISRSVAVHCFALPPSPWSWSPRAPNAAVMAPWTGCFITVSPQLLQLGAYCRARHTSAPGSLLGTLQVLNLNALGFVSAGNLAMTPIPLAVQP